MSPIVLPPFPEGSGGNQISVNNDKIAPTSYIAHNRSPLQAHIIAINERLPEQ